MCRHEARLGRARKLWFRVKLRWFTLCRVELCGRNRGYAAVQHAGVVVIDLLCGSNGSNGSNGHKWSIAEPLWSVCNNVVGCAAERGNAQWLASWSALGIGASCYGLAASGEQRDRCEC